MPEMDLLTTIFSHHMWSNLRMLEAVAQLTPEQQQATMPGAFGSIYVTMQHIVTSERSYFSRVSTGQPIIRSKDLPPMTIAEMEEALRASGTGILEWIHKVQPGDRVEVNWDGVIRHVHKTFILTQIINHANEHREQIRAIMTGLGIEPPAVQGWDYFDALYM